MDEKSVVASLALHAVLEPVFQEVSRSVAVTLGGGGMTCL